MRWDAKNLQLDGNGTLLVSFSSFWALYFLLERMRPWPRVMPSKMKPIFEYVNNFKYTTRFKRTSGYLIWTKTKNKPKNNVRGTFGGASVRGATHRSVHVLKQHLHEHGRKNGKREMTNSNL